MTLQYLHDHENTFGLEINREYVDPSGKSKPIRDGIVCPEEYLAAKSRILWVLKEPWDEEDRSGGGWSLTKDILFAKHAGQRANRTFAPITYLTHGIYSGEKWDDMPDIPDKPEMLRELLKIGFINVRKLPGLKQSSYSEIWSAYVKWGDIVHRQIEAYQPDLVFGCKPHLPSIAKHFGVAEEDWKNNGHVRYATKGGRSYFSVWHPAHRRKRQRWVDEILEAVKVAREAPAEP